MVRKSSSTQPFATKLPNSVGPPSCRRRDTPNSARRSSRMEAGAMIGPSSVLTSVETNDLTPLAARRSLPTWVVTIKVLIPGVRNMALDGADPDVAVLEEVEFHVVVDGAAEVGLESEKTVANSSDGPAPGGEDNCNSLGCGGPVLANHLRACACGVFEEEAV